MPASTRTRQFVWTVIPSGRLESGGQRALFSVLLTPRLTGPADAALTVGDFGLQTWPQRLATVSFTALRGDRQLNTTPAPALSQDGHPIDLTGDERLRVWQKIFPRTMAVRAYRPTSYQDRDVRQFPAGEVGTEVKGAFAQTARATALLGPGADCPGAEHIRRRQELETALRRIASTWQTAALAAGDDRSAARTPPLRRAYDFYRREAAGFTALGPGRVAAEPPEFHSVVARLADHPALLRALGLLMDFSVPVADLSGAGSSELRIDIRWPTPDTNPPPGWAGATQEDLRPRTSYTLSGDRFLPLAPPAGGSTRPQGLLPLAGANLAGEGTNAGFEIMPFDVDGAALRMFSAASSDRGDIPASALDTAGLPALRSMGFALVDKRRRSAHDARLNRAKERDTPAKLEGTPLTADNLIAGYRVDVLDNGQWRSLCQRRIRYTVDGVKIGHSAGTLGLLDEGFVRLDGATTGAGAHDAIYIHETVARWDGWSLVIARPERVADQTTDPPPPPPFTVEAVVDPGSLPPLMFGREYRLRVRLVDLAGGGLRRGQVAGNEQVSEKIVHRRFEPLPPPELAPTAAYVDGAGQGLMVIRSDRGVTAEAYAAAHGYRAVDARFLFAPPIPLGLAMQHPGAFDTALGPAVADAELRRQFDLAKRSDNDLADLGAVLTDGGNESGKYFVVPDAPAQVPWLADYASDYVTLRCRSRPTDPYTNLPGATQGFDRFQYTWKGGWPGRMPIALQVAAAQTGCTARHSVSGDKRTFSIELGPAEQVTVDIVSCPDIDFIHPWLGVAYWAGASPTDPTHPVNDNVYRGRNPLVTPPRTVTMVHAVQRPVADPGGRLVAERSMGQTHATLNPEHFDIHVPSTGRIDLRATWTDIEDHPPAAPRKNVVTANVGSYDIAHKPPRLDPPDGAFPLLRHEFGDVRRRRVTYSVTAISRFRDFFGRITAQDPQACTVKGTLEVTDVPAAVRPPIPKIRYTVPSFHWSRSEQGNVITSSRRGGALRVMLERPWFATGADEALAVLAWPTSSPAPSTKDLKQLSLGGRDPLRATPAPEAVLKPAHFRAFDTQTVVLPELGKSVVAMISPVDFTKNFDAEANCWFADVDLSPLAHLSYFPFVRLALCRYQSNLADPGQRLSPPVLTEPLQLFPHRDFTVTRSPGRATVVVGDPNPSAATLTGIRAELQVFAGDPRAAADGLIGPNGWNVVKHATGRLGDSLPLDIPATEQRPLRIAVTETESYPGAVPSRIVYADVVTLVPSA